MSTTTDQLTQLISATTELKDYFEKVRGDIDRRVADKLAELDRAKANLTQLMNVRLYVDQVKGDNDHDGLSTKTALRSIREAVSRVAPGGYGRISILGDYHNSENVYLHYARNIYLEGIPQDGAEQITMTFDLIPSGKPEDKHVELASPIYFSRLESTGSAASFLRIKFMIPDQAAVPTGYRVGFGHSAIVAGWSISKSPLIPIGFTLCAFEMPENPSATVIGASGGNIALYLAKSTYNKEMIAGHWVYGIKAGTMPKDTGRVLSNLSSL